MNPERIAPQELYKRIGPSMFSEAYRGGKSLSAHLEELDPSSGHEGQLDAFQRVMQAAKIKTRSLPAYGVYADRFEKFTEGSESDRALAMEYVAREWRAAATGVSPSTRALYLSSDTAPGTIMRPYVDAASARMKQLAPAIPLSELVAITTRIDNDTYRSFYLTDDVDEARMKRVAEGTEVPRAILRGSEHVVRLKKYGRAIEITYEQLKRMQIDMVALHIARMAIQSESDKVESALNVLINGDGNPNTAAVVHNQTALHAGSAAGTLTVESWLAYKLKFTNPYVLTTLLAQEASALQLLLLSMGSPNIKLVQIAGSLGVGGLRPINPELGREVGYGVTASAPALKLVGFDNRLALEHVTEIGANMTEVERYISRQTQLLVMTEIEGFAIFDGFATRILNINA
jgi:hypothetical protein